MELCVAHFRPVPRGLPVAGLLILVGAGVSGGAYRGAWAATAACPPTAIVEGSAEIAHPVSLILRQHGVGAGPSSCGGPVIRALLTRSAAAAAYTLHIVDGYGRASERQVADPGDAASLIESWATE